MLKKIRSSLEAQRTAWVNAISYMERGQDPENRRAVTRLSGGQREIPFDPMNAFYIKQVALQRRRSAL